MNDITYRYDKIEWERKPPSAAYPEGRTLAPHCPDCGAELVITEDDDSYLVACLWQGYLWRTTAPANYDHPPSWFTIMHNLVYTHPLLSLPPVAKNKQHWPAIWQGSHTPGWVVAWLKAVKHKRGDGTLVPTIESLHFNHPSEGAARDWCLAYQRAKLIKGDYTYQVPDAWFTQATMEIAA